MKRLANAILILTGMFFIPVAVTKCYPATILKPDSMLAAEIKHQLNTGVNNPALHFPVSVKRFYNQRSFQPAWIRPQGGEGQAWQAMLLLDCVLQYGLAHNDYHPKKLLYDRLHDLLDSAGKKSVSEKAGFDMVLTDAMITLINHLHYGKLNPNYTAITIDTGCINGFRAENELQNAILQTTGLNFLAALQRVQPKSKAYQDMQYHMRLLTGLYTGDCYQIPESDIRLLAINMERMRWAATDDSNYLQVNIPSFTMKFYQKDSVSTFRVVVGKPFNPTPTFNSAISYFTTAPDARVMQDVFRDHILPGALNDPNYLRDNHLAIYDRDGKFIVPDKVTIARIAENPDHYFARHASGCDWALGNLVFHLSNPFNIDLHDMPKQVFFDQEERAFSSGCIWVDHAEKLAGMLLKNDGRKNELKTLHRAVNSYKRKTFILTKQVPVQITYLTCEVNEGRLIVYKDIYNLDKSLETALYNVNQSVVMR